MDRLERNDSLALMRWMTHAEREMAREMIDLVECHIPDGNPKQKAAWIKKIRSIEARTKAETLKSLQDFGVIDKSITFEDLKHMR